MLGLGLLASMVSFVTPSCGVTDDVLVMIMGLTVWGALSIRGFRRREQDSRTTMPLITHLLHAGLGYFVVMFVASVTRIGFSLWSYNVSI